MNTKVEVVIASQIPCTCPFCGNGPELCHLCGRPVETVLDQKQWCKNCGRQQRSSFHGWDRYADQEPFSELREHGRERLRRMMG